MIGLRHGWRRRPRLSVIVVVYDMARELPRTLRSLTLDYQQGVAAEDYEVWVIDNGSPQPFGATAVAAFGRNFRYHYMEDAQPSPARALNRGAALARGRILGLMIDGARMLTPGLLAYALAAFRIDPDSTVAVPGWHLGPDLQQRAVTQGYDRQTEDRLLETIGWPSAGYRLFEIAVPAGSSADGCFLPLAESNALFVTRAGYRRLGGYDERFDLPGGGLANLDFYRRAVERPGSPLVLLPGEGAFHQLHGGVSTNIDEARLAERWRHWGAQYRRIRGMDYRKPAAIPVLFGRIPPAALGYIERSARVAREVGS